MNEASKLLRALRASPLSLTYALLMCGLWVMALPLAATADLLILIWNQLVRLKRRLCSYVTWKTQTIDVRISYPIQKVPYQKSAHPEL